MPPDCDKFAQECIDLVDQIRRTHRDAQSSETELSSLESHARLTLEQIHQMQNELRLEPGEEDASFPEAIYEKLTMSTEVKNLFEGMHGVEENDVEDKVGEPNKPWTIEGMYTGYSPGHGQKELSPPEKGAVANDGMDVETDVDTAGGRPPKTVFSDRENIASSAPNKVQLAIAVARSR